MTPIYEHRNGETEPPTIHERHYWFWSDDYERIGILRGIFYVMPPEDDIDAYILCDDSYYDAIISNGRIAINNLRGRWWGPVISPWHNQNGEES